VSKRAPEYDTAQQDNASPLEAEAIDYRGMAHCKEPNSLEARQALHETLTLCRAAGIEWTDSEHSSKNRSTLSKGSPLNAVAIPRCMAYAGNPRRAVRHHSLRLCEALVINAKENTQVPNRLLSEQ
jgi:hypothetical protein